MARELELKSENHGFDLLAGQGGVQLCRLCFIPDPLSCVRHGPKFVHTLKIPYPSVVKEPVVWKHGSTAHRGRGGGGLGNAIQWLLAFTWKTARIYLVHCTWTIKLSNLITYERDKLFCRISRFALLDSSESYFQNHYKNDTRKCRQHTDGVCHNSFSTRKGAFLLFCSSNFQI